MKLLEGIDLYVERKRVNGVSFNKGNANLISFQRQVGNVALEKISTNDVLKFLDGPLTSTVTWRGKHSLLYHFFDFWAARGVRLVPVMPLNRPVARQTFTPYIYTRAEIRLLLRAAKACQREDSCSIDARTLRSLITTAYATGALVGQVLGLRRKDINLKMGTITFHSGRLARSRVIPIGRDLKSVLNLQLGVLKTVKAGEERVFAKKDGSPILARTLCAIFKRLREKAGVLREDGSFYQPRMHDLRATFAVHRITSWIKNHADLNRMLPALATYMGHAELTAGDRYLSLTPERFRTGLNSLSKGRPGKRWRDDAALMKFLTEL